MVQEICRQHPLPLVADTLTENPDFIKVRFHIRRFITTRVGTEKEHAVTEALKCNLEFAKEQIKVSVSFQFLIIVLLSILTPRFFQQLFEHS
jgi:hypothetical protein